MLYLTLIRNIMKYIELREKLKDLTVFSIKDIEKSADKRFHRRRLNEWQDKNYIKKIIKGYYIFSDPKLDDNVLYEIANKIYNPSYISLETALSYYGLIPESVYALTSVSTRKTITFNTSIAVFSYRKIRDDLFFGYIIENHDKKVYKIASPEKAILDLLYLKTDIRSYSDFESLRINPGNFIETIGREKLFNYLKLYNNKRLTSVINDFWEYINHA